MNAVTLQWVEILQRMGFVRCDAEAFVAKHLSWPVPIEMPEVDDQEFDIGGSD